MLRPEENHKLIHSQLIYEIWTQPLGMLLESLNNSLILSINHLVQQNIDLYPSYFVWLHILDFATHIFVHCHQPRSMSGIQSSKFCGQYQGATTHKKFVAALG